MTPQEIMSCTGCGRFDRAQEFAPFLDAAMEEFEINTPQRQAAFLAQIGHESGGLHFIVEVWGPTDAQRRYEMRHDLGNCETGDGLKYRGRGLIQITGRANYAKAGEALGVDLIEEPEHLGEPELAARSAAWFWQAHGLNELADAGEFEKITRRINGGLNGYAQRLGLYAAAKEALEVA
jgi:putative chitinase